MLTKIYDDKTMPCAQAFFGWHKRFLDHQDDVYEDPKSGWSKTAKADKNIVKVDSCDAIH
jgi:hypothetical protein